MRQKAIAVIVALAMAGVIYLLYEDNKKLAAELSETARAANELEVRFTNMANSFERLEKERAEFNKTAQQIDSTYKQIRRDMEGLKNREETVLANMARVERLVNQAYIKQQYALACITGDTTACETSQ